MITIYLIRTSSPDPSVVERLFVVVVYVSPETRFRDEQGITVQTALVIGDLKISLVLFHRAVLRNKREPRAHHNRTLVEIMKDVTRGYPTRRRQHQP